MPFGYIHPLFLGFGYVYTFIWHKVRYLYFGPSTTSNTGINKHYNEKKFYYLIHTALFYYQISHSSLQFLIPAEIISGHIFTSANHYLGHNVIFPPDVNKSAIAIMKFIKRKFLNYILRNLTGIKK